MFGPTLTIAVERREHTRFAFGHTVAEVVGKRAEGDVVTAVADHVDVFLLIGGHEVGTTGRAHRSEHTQLGAGAAFGAQHRLELLDACTNEISLAHGITRRGHVSVDDLGDEDVRNHAGRRQGAGHLALDVKDANGCGLRIDAIDATDDRVTDLNLTDGVHGGFDVKHTIGIAQGADKRRHRASIFGHQTATRGLTFFQFNGHAGHDALSYDSSRTHPVFTSPLPTRDERGPVRTIPTGQHAPFEAAGSRPLGRATDKAPN